MSSYKGKFGCVRYYARAVLDRLSQHALQCEREFEVEEPLDVNRADLLVRTNTVMNYRNILCSSSVNQLSSVNKSLVFLSLPDV